MDETSKEEAEKSDDARRKIITDIMMATGNVLEEVALCKFVIVALPLEVDHDAEDDEDFVTGNLETQTPMLTNLDTKQLIILLDTMLKTSQAGELENPELQEEWGFKPKYDA